MKSIFRMEFVDGEQKKIELPPLAEWSFTLEELVPPHNIGEVEIRDCADMIGSVFGIGTMRYLSIEYYDDHITVGIHLPEWVEGSRERIVSHARAFFS